MIKMEDLFRSEMAEGVTLGVGVAIQTAWRRCGRPSAMSWSPPFPSFGMLLKY